MSAPDVVVFDLGKVLVDFDYGLAVRKIAARSRMNAEQIHHLLLTSPLLLRYETGEISTGQFYREVCQASGFEGSLEEFSVLFSDIFSPIDPMIALHAALREQGVPTFIFSNTNELAVGHIGRTFPFFGHFTDYIYSFRHGSMKPDARLYEVVEKMTGRKGHSIFYLDDRLENIQTALQRGWQAHCHQDPESTLTLVRSKNWWKIPG